LPKAFSEAPACTVRTPKQKDANQTTLNRNRQKKAEDKEEDDNWLVNRRFFERRI
jgi:hypothetical protein